MSNLEFSFTHDEYRDILETGLAYGYRFLRFESVRSDTTEPFCLLRHDIDTDPEQAEVIAEIEKKIGIRSTYFVMLHSPVYNLLSRANTRSVFNILAMGHWLGLHFDELYYPDASPDELRRRVDEEAAFLTSRFGVNVKTVSHHQPSQRALNNEIILSSDLLDVYRLRNEFGLTYLSDTNMVWREDNPAIIFREQRYPRLQLLCHPMWWTPEPMSVKEKWNRAIIRQFERMQEQLLSVEMAYGRRRSFEISEKLSFEPF